MSVLLIYFLFFGAIILYSIIWYIKDNPKRSIKIRDKKDIFKNRKISFDEFDDLEKIKRQKKKEMEYETDIMEMVYNEENEHQNKKYEIPEENIELRKKAENARRHLFNLKIQDDLDVLDENMKESNPALALKESGYDYDIGLFKKWSRQIFGCIKIGTEEQLKVVKNFISDELYDRYIFQEKQFEKDRLKFVTDDLIINKCYIYDYSKGVTKEEIKVLINASMKEYIMNIDTHKVVRGSKSKTYNKNIIMTFSRQNIDEVEGLIHNCPNCGAEVSQTELGKCRYCNTLIFPIRYNWTLTKFETV